MNAPDPRFMDAALRLAARGLGRTGDNPSVGCVLVRDGRVLGRGRTAPGGRPHAETEALADAARRFGADAARGADVYATLEPCAHRGRTPPCADALIAAGVGRVCAAIEDPDPRVAGAGLARLRAAGVAVETGMRAEAAETLLRGYLSRKRRGRPFVTLKLAASLDGRIATPSGESRWISGPEARARVHALRARSDAILVGVGTALADDPMLDPRLPGLADHAPLRVVADGRLQTPLTGRLAQSARERPLLLLTRADADPERAAAFAEIGAQTLAIPHDARGALDMGAALAALADRGVSDLLCEGGGHVAASLIRDGLADALVWFAAGVALGGDGAPAVADFGLERLADAPRFRQVALESVGADVMQIWAAQG